MNYGRFFRLNQSLSKVVDGVAVYDYIDLPAYFGPSIENPMSPKYPISVTITADVVCFRLHYSAFKIEGKDIIGNPRYAYDKDDINNKSFPIETGSSMGMAHMEETILEIPYMDNGSCRLSDTLKSIYSTTFPQVENDNTSMGGRFLEQLIRKRYPKVDEWKSVEELERDGDLEALLYGTLREASDDSPSYSTLWLMDLMRNIKGKSKRRIELYDEKYVVAFLRKLFLDFLFDLRHSDVFQNSTCYQKMYTGLMSNFYFSALLHKCEYYYHRKLVRNAINGKEFNRDNIVMLYAEELFRAEDLWTKDIMSSQAEEYFDYFYDKRHYVWQELKEDGLFDRYPSWFADPEEEMRRVCFTMREREGTKERHMCNMDVLIRLLDIRRDGVNNNFIEAKMVKMRDDSHKLISQWFLKRYDFKDLFHLHLYKFANSFLIIVLVITLLLLMPFIGMDLRYIAICSGGLFFILNLCKWFYIYQRNPDKKYEIDKRRNAMALSRIKGACSISGILTLIMTLGLFPIGELCDTTKDYLSSNNICPLFIMSTLIVVSLFVIFPWKSLRWRVFGKAICSRIFPIEPKLQHVMSNLHLLLPRLVATIAASWITLSMGFDLYVSFFDARPSWPTIFVLLIILLLFVMYEINRVTPNSNSWLKLYRSIELIVISYAISLVIGLIVINFLGERFLEKGGYVGEDEFYKQYVENEVGFKYENGDDKIVPEKIAPFNLNVQKLNSVYHSSESGDLGSYPVVEHIKFFKWDILVLRDFLIMFSFITMFMGMFIQLIILGDNKQMTEL